MSTQRTDERCPDCLRPLDGQNCRAGGVHDLPSSTDESVVGELAIFWNEIALNLPKSIERSALGDEKIFRAFQIAYPKMREYLLTSKDVQHKAEVETARKEEREAVVRIAECYMNVVDFNNFCEELNEPELTLTNKES